MRLSEAIEVMEGAVGHLPVLASPPPDMGPDDWETVSRVVLPRLRALRATLTEVEILDERTTTFFKTTDPEITPFMERCVIEIARQAKG